MSSAIEIVRGYSALSHTISIACATTAIHAITC